MNTTAPSLASRSRQRPKIVGLLAVGVLVGLGVAGFVCYAALDLNQQGEYIDQETGAWLWSSILPLFGACFGLGFFASTALGSVILLAFSALRRLAPPA